MKKSISVLLAVVMVLAMLLSACGSSETSSTTPAGNNSESTSSNTNNTPANNTPAATGDDEEEGWDEITDLKLVLCSVGEKSGWADIEAKINEIAEEKAGVHINVEWIEIGAWVQQMNLKMSSSEALDIIHVTPLMTFTNLYAANELLDITDELSEDGQDLLSLIPQTYWDGMSVNGRVYGVPMLFPKQGGVYVGMLKKVLDELGLTEKAMNMSTWSEYEEILQAVKDNTDMIPMYINAKANTATTYPDTVDVSADDWSVARGMDNLGDSYSLIYVDDNGKVQSYYHSNIFQADMARAADFYQKGLVYRDGATTDVESLDALKDDIAFSALIGTEVLTAQTSAEARIGQESVIVSMCPQIVTTLDLNRWSYAVPYTSKNADAAVRFLNLLYTDKEVADLFTWGIEGRDWQRNDDGTGSVLWGQNQYFSQYWLHGNANIITAAQGSPADYYERTADIIANQPCSDYVGFVCDVSSILNELTACNNAKQQYAYGLLAGSVNDYEAEYAAFIKQLDDSGMQKIIDCYQEQLDAWLASK